MFRHFAVQMLRSTLVIGIAAAILVAPRAAVSTSPNRDSAPAEPQQAPFDISLTPSEGEPKLLVSDDLQLDLLLQEPTVANPVYMTFDERGRLWVTQFRQYPWPAGLKLLSRDSVYRNIYSPPFAPPPPHAVDSPFRGKDRVTIHEDRDGDGRFDETKVFVDGLNLASAALPGRGGVFVINPPYLLFYADRNRDDVPDAETPEILLSGFGFEDSHALANSLRWGPDGWIYAAQGSTVTSNIVTYGADGKPLPVPPIRSMGQNIWRYHPERRIYEIYAEGGGNAFGVEIDKAGRIFSGHNGGDTRGFHYVQGGYYQKTFGKHGQLSNPYAFDYLPAMRGSRDQRFTHMFCINEAEGLPERYREKMLAVNPIEHRIILSDVAANGASRETKDVGVIVRDGEGERADWFIPVDIQIGPDSAIYIADWYSQQANHYRNHEGKTDPDLGRVYRLRGTEYAPTAARDLSQLSSYELVADCLRSSNRWERQQALRLLGDRRDRSVIPQLQARLGSSEPQASLEAFWALNACGGLDAKLLSDGLAHANSHVRRWTLHLLGDHPELAETLTSNLKAIASDDADVEVRCQLAATAKRLPSEIAVPLVFRLMQRESDASDPFIPKFAWWALESHADAVDAIAGELADEAAWKSAYRVDGASIPQLLVRRFALSGRKQDLLNCARIISLAPNKYDKQSLAEGFAAAFAGRPMPALPDELAEELAKSDGPFAQILAIRRSDPTAIREALTTISSAEVDDALRTSLIQAIGDEVTLPNEAVPCLQQIVVNDDDWRIVNAALLALQKFDAENIGVELAKSCTRLPVESQPVAIQVLASRSAWAKDLVAALRSEAIPRAAVDANCVARLRCHADSELQQEVADLFPVTKSSVSELESRIETLANLVKDGQGSPLDGRKLFHEKASCGKCHRLFESGGEIGPDLTAYNRVDVSRMLLALVNPNAEIREGYESFTVQSVDGRVLSGFKVEEDDQVLVLRGIDGQLQTIAKADIEETAPGEVSLMPERLLDSLTEQEIRDLFAYLSSTTPPM